MLTPSCDSTIVTIFVTYMMGWFGWEFGIRAFSIVGLLFYWYVVIAQPMGSGPVDDRNTYTRADRALQWFVRMGFAFLLVLPITLSLLFGKLERHVGSQVERNSSLRRHHS